MNDFPFIPYLQKSQASYICTDIEILDFTKVFKGNLIIYTPQGNFSIPLDEIRNLPTIFHILVDNVFCYLTIGWNLKALFSYFKFHYRHKQNLENLRIFDLKLAEQFTGNNTAKPDSFSEAIDRLKIALSDEKTKKIAKQIHKPLLTSTLPEIETRRLLYKSQNKIFPFYHIEGQVNGRLSSSKVGKMFFCPHTLSQEERKSIGLPDVGQKFLSLDFAHMEVSMLAYLSKDPLLVEINNQEKDLYQVVYKEIFEEECNTNEQRNLIKKVFLPIMYGEQTATLASNLGYSSSDAANIIKIIRIKFSTAYDWLKEKQEQLNKNDTQIDFLGRRRKFSERPWSVRNFHIQSPAALVCLEKLIELNRKLPVILHIHDEYILMLGSRESFNTAKASLLSDSNLCPGLKLHIKAKFGENLAEMKKLPLT